MLYAAFGTFDVEKMGVHVMIDNSTAAAKSLICVLHIVTRFRSKANTATTSFKHQMYRTR
jgi:hypothetical protein